MTNTPSCGDGSFDSKWIRQQENSQEKLRKEDNPTKQGVKFDADKIRMDLLPPEALIAVADVLTGGAEKYGAYNWAKGMDWSRPYGAALRHLYAWWGGENKDKDTGKSHLWHACTNLVFLIVYESRGKGTDDRPNKGMDAPPSGIPREIDLPPPKYLHSNWTQFTK